MLSHIRNLALTGAVVLELGCRAEPRVGSPLATPTSAGSSFSTIAADVLVPRCATSACHAGVSPAYTPSLDAELAYDALYAQPSTQGSELLVDPGAPERSYLLLKLRGTGSGALMPIGDVPLDEGEIAAIEAWIASGAPND